MKKNRLKKKTEDQTEDKENNASYNLVLEQELRIVSRMNYDFRADSLPLRFHSSNGKSILREKCTILEQQYKINRRLSPRKLISVGKSVEPPPMAPSETYVSTYESEISESQLKVKNLIKINF